MSETIYNPKHHETVGEFINLIQTRLLESQIGGTNFNPPKTYGELLVQYLYYEVRKTQEIIDNIGR